MRTLLFAGTALGTLLATGNLSIGLLLALRRRRVGLQRQADDEAAGGACQQQNGTEQDPPPDAPLGTQQGGGAGTPLQGVLDYGPVREGPAPAGFPPGAEARAGGFRGAPPLACRFPAVLRQPWPAPGGQAGGEGW